MNVNNGITLCCISVAFEFLCGPASATTLCAGGDSLSVSMAWHDQLPPEYDVTSVGVGGDTTRTWTSFHPNTRIYDLVDCALQASEDDEVFASINLGTNDELVWNIPREEFISNAADAIETIAPYFDQIVWFWPFYDEALFQVCNEWEHAHCVPQASVIGFGDYLEDIPWGCCHPNEQGGAKLAAEFLRRVPEPSSAAASFTALITVLMLRAVCVRPACSRRGAHRASVPLTLEPQVL